ncbi:hypothetical protein THASP1DRAFT_25583 [Thamnocephalis sphaerospora]|uniref:CCDC43 PWI-like domain-containing protein n=1 Tax=Thamnocephalis sphaerospora TaxID=78915 RepID=A0A4P9XKQ5_9FUNG|nr:hypothetical protein THASP1DRAFT_25583 [Thamnocephalis sphaerospora]|eukprot:RKP06021.1 hypothetical protein THASP1DRAFT_25583 [Thamnocephalis sphaerospora]
MDTFVAQQLAGLGVDDEMVCEYVARLVEDDDLEEDERREAIVDYLSATTEASVDSAVDAIFVEWKRHAGQAQEQAAAVKQQEQLAAREREKRELMADMRTADDGEDPVNIVKEMTREERERRERLLARYGFDLDEIVETADGETEIVYKDRTESNGGGDDQLAANRNRAIIADKERAQRDNLRQEHQKKVERDRELLEKQRLDKEKEKRRTQKRIRGQVNVVWHRIGVEVGLVMVLVVVVVVVVAAVVVVAGLFLYVAILTLGVVILAILQFAGALATRTLAETLHFIRCVFLGTCIILFLADCLFLAILSAATRLATVAK